ncbi:cobyrinic acid ac-diamide synthase [Caballeronia sp. LjRoot34]|uniref:IS66 family insertion sequence element accessory protein TnpA n=1 Tax=Caballeronia sp. LjRoot34 TaxID=3342325 RepID=UPI003ECF5ED5
MQAGLEFWAPHVAAIEQESVATAVYAKRHGLALHSLYYWRQKIKTAGAQTSGSPERSSAFVALTVSEPVLAQPSGSCTVVLGADVRVELAALPSAEWLAALGRAMQGAR